MMMKQITVIIPLTVLVVLMVTSCRDKQEQTNAIPILAWYSIPPEQTSLDRYLELKESGITYNLSFFRDTVSMAEALDIAQKAGIRMIVYCPELKSATEKTVRKFMNHPAVAGYMLRDEPNRADFRELGEWAEKIRSIDDKHFCYLNLFPTYANEEQLGTKTYQEYVDLFREMVPVQFISFDHYPVLGDSLRADWYENLEIISDAAEKAGKPFWAFALSVAHGNYPVPTLAQLRLQMFSNLAYGAQGLQYFTYWTPYDTTWNFNNAPLSLEGKRTIVYDRIRQMNKEIVGLTPLFLGAKVISVCHTGDQVPRGTHPLAELPQPVRSLRTVGNGAVVSHLENGPDAFLVIVNRDFLQPMTLIIECENNVFRLHKDGSKVPANVYQQAIEVDPGDIAVYTWKI